jgi:PKD repeat protein
MKTTLAWLLWFAALAPPVALNAASNQLLGWNNLGMHCMDSDYSVFSILPPYNTIEAQLIVAGKLVTNGVGYTVTYQAVADPDGSFNSTARGKGNFYNYVLPLYGAGVQPEFGLTPWPMPGTNNTPQAMLFEQTNRPAPGVATKANWFRAEGIPITPYDDAGLKNPYPLMRLIARNSSGTVIASNDIVLPVSDEMDCRVCHASGTQASARPRAGWVWSANPERDYRLNILRLHDQRQFDNHAELYAAALAARGFNPQGLYRGVVADGKPALCASCHASEALGTGSYSNIPPLTASIHSKHANVMDPDLRITLDNSLNRAACYRCHPGSATKCLRGAMGSAIDRDGTMSMQCQSCHGSMSQVGASDRVGWFMEPNCQSCHTGHATSNNGQIRYTSVFETNGTVRVATNQTFATQPNMPAAGLSLYRFSAGHGGLQCSACHGSTHAEFPATHRNDNLRNEKIQGHAGATAECTACHVSMPNNATTAVGGPHGMHPIGQGWVSFHHDAIHSDTDHQKCAACHGADFRGSVLSRALGPRTLTASLDGGSVTLNLFQGAMIGCYNCHNGPRSENLNTSAAPVASDITTNTTSGQVVAMTLPVTGVNAAARIISQPRHGSVGLSNAIATYFPDPGFVGADTFTFAAWDGSKNSALATGTVVVAEGPYSIAVRALVPPQYSAGWPVAFTAVATPSNTTTTITYEWDFGDGTLHDTNRHASHTYAVSGTYFWSLTTRAGSATAGATGAIVVGDAIRLSIMHQPGGGIVSWPRTTADAVLEVAGELEEPAPWRASTNTVLTTPATFEVDVSAPPTNGFFRLRQAQ